MRKSVPDDIPSYTSEEFSRDLVELTEVAQDAIVLLDDDFRLRYLNRTAEHLLHKPRAELLGRSIWDECPDFIGTEMERQIRRVMRERVRSRYENYYAHVQRWLEFQMNPLSRGGIVMWVCDVTDRKRLQESAEHSAATLTALMANVPEGVTVSNAAGKIELVSKYSLDIIKCSPEDVVGVPVESCGEKWHVLRMDGSIPEPHELPGVRSLRGETINLEEWLLETGDGTRIGVSCNASPILGPEGKITGSVLAWRDISGPTAEQEREAENRNIAVTATLARGVAHQLNNSLTSIIGYISLAHDEPDLSKARRLLGASLDAAQQSAELVRKLLAFGGRSVFNAREGIDLAEQIRNFEGIMRAKVPERIRLEFNLAEDAPRVHADPEQIKGALIALLVNAVEAIKEGPGTITVKTCVGEFTKRALQGLRNGSKLKSGTYVSIEVRDTGAGIPAEHQSRIFDPFFSTKFLGRGLGLATIDGLARSHNGAIGLTTEAGRGTEFRLYLPAA